MDNKIIDESKQGEALVRETENKGGKKMFLESYGCQMNFADSEIVASILIDKGYTTTTDYKEADLIFVNTCAIRENAESRVRQRLYDYKKVKKTNKNLINWSFRLHGRTIKTSVFRARKIGRYGCWS
jgi:tRNA-2-methylthio-N6-dimethylallyladenosine synthase